MQIPPYIFSAFFFFTISQLFSFLKPWEDEYALCLLSGGLSCYLGGGVFPSLSDPFDRFLVLEERDERERRKEKKKGKGNSETPKLVGGKKGEKTTSISSEEKQKLTEAFYYIWKQLMFLYGDNRRWRGVFFVFL